MIFRQIIHEDLGCASYLVGDPSAKVAAVVDPRFDSDVYLELAAYLGVQITDIFETHNHADHVSGHGRLAAATGATIHVHSLVGAQFSHLPFEHGDEWEIGAVRLRAMHTPGHRPEHTAFLLTDLRRGNDPWALLSGDSLFVGDIARPDLAVEPAEGARGIFNSLHAQVLPLPDYIELWPGHLGGSMCGGPGMDLKVSSSIGYERRNNHLLRVVDEQEFTDELLSGLGAQPPNFTAIVELNRGPLLTAPPHLGALDRTELATALDDGALLIDVRGHPRWAAGHVPGSVSIPAGATGFGTRLAWLASGGAGVVLIGEGDADAAAAAPLAAAVGLSEHLAHLSGGFPAWQAGGGVPARTEQLQADELPARLSADASIQVLDVRDYPDWEADHLPGSICLPWHDVIAVPEEFDPAAPIAVICASGQRAGIAAGLLERAGATQVIHVHRGGVRDALRTLSAQAS